jgi:hypothetical protein
MLMPRPHLQGRTELDQGLGIEMIFKGCLGNANGQAGGELVILIKIKKLKH